MRAPLTPRNRAAASASERGGERSSSGLNRNHCLSASVALRPRGTLRVRPPLPRTTASPPSRSIQLTDSWVGVRTARTSRLTSSASRKPLEYSTSNIAGSRHSTAEEGGGRPLRSRKDWVWSTGSALGSGREALGALLPLTGFTTSPTRGAHHA